MHQVFVGLKMRAVVLCGVVMGGCVMESVCEGKTKGKFGNFDVKKSKCVRRT